MSIEEAQKLAEKCFGETAYVEYRDKEGIYVAGQRHSEYKTTLIHAISWEELIRMMEESNETPPMS